ncbi:hypothetical protein [Microbacterium sp. NPDC058345]|uniref:hypothetical protein n=1 Tax=Microbacterium sp. NPDC058345 TaxID=3346455 RepID=UPI003659CBA6
MTAFLVKIALVLLAVALVVVVVARARKRPNRSKEHPDRIRMPRLVVMIGAAVLVVGFFMGLMAFTAEENPQTPGALLPMRIAAVVMFLVGGLFVAMYLNWYVSPGLDEVRFRSVLGREKTIAYADIVDYRTTSANGQPRLRIRAADGTRLALNPATFDMSPLMTAIAFKERTGRWPLRGEAR